MSVMSYVTVWCDEYPGAALMACGEYVNGDDAADARKNAKALGWKVAQVGDGLPHYGRLIRRDYCPEHARINSAFEDGAVL